MIRITGAVLKETGHETGGAEYMNVQLKEDERIDDLERNGYRIIQNRNRFCFGMDAVLLSVFAAEGEAERLGKGKGRGRKQPLQIADLGTGTGIIPLLLYGRLRPKAGASAGRSEQSGQEPDIRITGLEIQDEMCDMASRSVQLNGLDPQIRIIHGDIREAAQILGNGVFDAVTSNPPYMKPGGGLTNPDSSKAISRHEILCTFRDVAEQAAALLKTGGRFYLVHRPERLTELIVTLKQAGLEPKRLQMVHSFQDSKASMVLIEAARSGGAFLKVEKPLIIYQEQGVYTEEILKQYGY